MSKMNMDQTDDGTFYDAEERVESVFNQDVCETTSSSTDDSADYQSANDMPFIPSKKDSKPFNTEEPQMFCGDEDGPDKTLDNKNSPVVERNSFLTNHSSLLYEEDCPENLQDLQRTRCCKNRRRWMDRGVEKMKMVLSREGLTRSIQTGARLQNKTTKQDVLYYMYKGVSKSYMIERQIGKMIAKLRNKLKYKTQMSIVTKQEQTLKVPTQNDTSAKRNEFVAEDKRFTDPIEPSTEIITEKTPGTEPTIYKGRFKATPGRLGLNLRISQECLREIDPNAEYYVTIEKQDRAGNRGVIYSNSYYDDENDTTRANTMCDLSDQNLHLQPGDPGTVKVTVNMSGDEILALVLGMGASISKLTKYPIFRSIVARYIPKHEDFYITTTKSTDIVKTLEEDSVLTICRYPYDGEIAEKF